MPHHGLKLKIWQAGPLLDSQEAGGRVSSADLPTHTRSPLQNHAEPLYKRRLTGQGTTTLGSHQTHTWPHTVTPGQHHIEQPPSIWSQEPVLSTVPSVRSPHLTNFKSYMWQM